MSQGATPASRNPLTIVVASLDPAVQAVWSALREEGIASQVATCYDDAAEFLASSARAVLVLDEDLAEADLLRLDKLAGSEPPFPVLRVQNAREAATSPIWCDSPLQERVAKPVTGAVLALRVKALALQAGFELPVPTSDQVAALEAARANPAGSLIVVYGAKGGVGKSTIAVNLGVCLSQTFRRNVLLADADLWYGDIGVLLDVRSQKSLFDICAGTEVDLFGLPKAVVPHPLGLSVLLRPHDPRQVERISNRLVAQSLRMYCSLYEYVLVDTGPTLDDINLQVLDVADQVLLVTTPELASIHNCARFLGLAEILGYADKVRLVVNRANSGVNLDALRRTLKLPVFGRLVSSGRLVVEAANQGTSVFTVDPGEQDPFTRDVVTLTEQIVARRRPEGKRTATPRRRWWPPFRLRAAA